MTIAHRFFVLLAALVAGVLGANAQTGTFRFGSANYSVTESGGAAKITVTRSGGSAGTVTVDFLTLDSGGGTAVPEEDYYPTNGTLTFGPGVTSQFFFVPIIDDAVHENGETVNIQLVNLGIETSLTISDNDDCEFAVSSTSVSFDANGGLAPTILVTATGGCSWIATNTTSGANWLGIIKIIYHSSGTGNGEVILSLDPNPGSSSRTARLKIAGKNFTVTQLPVPPPDLTPPTITITSPAANSRQTMETITVTGKATDNVAVTLVEARLENDAETSDYVEATGTANWSVNLGGLIPGTNTIRVRAWDAEDTPSESTRTVIFVAVSPLSLVTNGIGSITPLRNGQLLDVGKSYSAQARAAKYHFFTGWSGSIESIANPLTFDMQSNFLLQANFTPSPFPSVAGTYNGLSVESEANRHASSGFLTIKVTDLGAFSAKMTLGGNRSSFSGKFALDGHATNTISRTGASSLTVVLSVDFSGSTDQISGTVSDGDWTASVLCDRALFNKITNPALHAGRYTLIMPGEDEQADEEPGGYSYGTVTVDAGGGVKFSATLADGTKVTQKASLSKDGWWPLYVPLYGGNGSILSRVVFAESSEADFTGAMNWVKPPLPTAKFYPAGFAVQHELTGARYIPPTNSMDAVLNFAAGKVRFDAGDLAEDFDNDVSLLDNKVTNLSANKLTLSITLSSGLFSGTVTVPGTTQSIPFKGALHKKQNQGWGFFVGSNASGRVRFSE